MPKPSIVSVIEGYEADAIAGGELQVERAKDLQYYNGELPKGNGLPDRSQVVSRDVSDAVERLKPAIIRVFCSGDDVVSFDPTGQEDIDAAQQETDYCNYIITQKNEWFATAYQWFDDALIQKNGYVKAWWDESEDITKETYKSQTDDQVALLVQDPEVSIIEMSSYPNPIQPPPAIDMMTGQPMPQPVSMLYDVTVQRKKTYGCVKYTGLPPERVRVYKLHKHVSLQDCEFVEHLEDKSLSQLRLEGFDIEDDISDGATSTSDDNQADEIARNRYQEQIGMEGDSIDPAMRKVRVRECWVRHDEDEDGKAELRHVMLVGVTELLNEECDMVPVAALTPRIWSHRHIGMAIADFAKDIQDIKTQFHRGLIDNVNFAINGRTAVNKNKVNIEDAMTYRPAGLIRVDGEPAANVMPVVHQANFAPLMGALQYFDTVLEERTGANKSSGNMNPETLSKLPSGIAISQIMSASQAPVELISRVFAETGVKQLFRIVHALTLKNARKDEIVRLKNKWVVVDPRQWKKRSDMTISVGLGSGNKEQQAGALQSMIALELQLLPLGLSDKKTLFHVLSRYTQAQGFKDVQSFWNDPQENRQIAPPQQPQADPLKVADIKIKGFSAETDRFDAETKRIAAIAGARIDHAKVQQQGQQNIHGMRMDQENLQISRKPIEEDQRVTEQQVAAIMQALSGLGASIQRSEQGEAQRSEQLLNAILQMSRPRSKVIVRDPKTQRAVRADEVYTDSLSQ